MILLLLALQIAVPSPMPSAMPPLPPPVGHTLAIEVPAPTREVAQRYVFKVYIDADQVGVTLTGEACLPVVNPDIPWSHLYRCTGELPKVKDGWHTLRYTIALPGGSEGPESAILPFIYKAPPPAPPPGTNPQIK